MKKTASLFAALMLTAFVYPGLGQLAQGRKKLGKVIIALTSLILILFFYEFYQEIMNSMPVIEALNKGKISTLQATESIMLSLGDGKIVEYTIGLFLCWGVSIAEILYRSLVSEKEK